MAGEKKKSKAPLRLSLYASRLPSLSLSHLHPQLSLYLDYNMDEDMLVFPLVDKKLLFFLHYT